ncbi:Ankyrin repeat protein [Giardia duodenalis assemblage B]|uniref:Ankyrin repeat protein n=1 Tax=Giardia duodenalis assemblage B TaxID=1394984 RepID=A0A132NSF6_GIAIN|nr:Ankyrin repeat protein [Giardia intestinalis assemblage B]
MPLIRCEMYVKHLSVDILGITAALITVDSAILFMELHKNVT